MDIQSAIEPFGFVEVLTETELKNLDAQLKAKLRGSRDISCRFHHVFFHAIMLGVIWEHAMKARIRAKEAKMPEKNMDLVVGDKVRWESQAAGSWKKKMGVVVQVISAGKTPLIPADLRQECRLASFGGYGRSRVSYLVKVTPEKGNAKPTLYWPRASSLWKI